MCVTQNKPKKLHGYHISRQVVIHAYAKQRYRGNLLDLFEPGFGPAFAPWVVAADRLPENWFETTSTCDGECSDCRYCADALEQALIHTADPAPPHAEAADTTPD